MVQALSSHSHKYIPTVSQTTDFLWLQGKASELLTIIFTLVAT